MPAPRPILSVTIAPLSGDDGERVQTALEEVAQTVPPFTKAQEPSGEFLLAGESVIHLQAICAFLRHNRIEIAIGELQIIYLETILKTAEAEGKYIRQTGGSGNYGHVKIRLEPREPGAGIAFVHQVQGGVVPEKYLQPIEQGIREAARGGILCGREVVDFKAILYDGSHHEMDSNPMAFQIAASQAFTEAARKAHPVLMEPMMTTIFATTERRLAETLAEISSLRGRVDEVATKEIVAEVRAWVPLRAMLDYQGPAARGMRFSHYERTSWPPDGDDPANSGVRNPRGPRPGIDAAAISPDWDWT